MTDHEERLSCFNHSRGINLCLNAILPARTIPKPLLTMSEEELTKEQKLELARKKFDELKKNKKKGKKKGKKATAKQEGSENNSDNDDNDKEKEKNGSNINADGEAEVVENEVLNLNDSSAEQVGEKAEHTNIGDEGMSTEAQKDEEEVSEGSEVVESESSAEAAESAEPKVEAGTAKESSEEGTSGEITEQSQSEAPVSTKEAEGAQKTIDELSNEELRSEAITKDDTLGGILEESKPAESTFLTDTMKFTIKDLTEKNEALSQEVSNYKSENLDLKLSKMDLEMEIETLKNELETEKAQVKRMTQQLQTAKVDSRVRMKSPDNEDGMSILSGTEYLHSPSSFANLTTFNVNNASQDYMDFVDVKERLAQWKGWNMDMRGWRSIGMGPVVDM